MESGSSHQCSPIRAYVVLYYPMMGDRKFDGIENDVSDFLILLKRAHQQPVLRKIFVYTVGCWRFPPVYLRAIFHSFPKGTLTLTPYFSCFFPRKYQSASKNKCENATGICSKIAQTATRPGSKKKFGFSILSAILFESESE